MKISEVSYFQGLFAVTLKKPLNLHLAYFIETLYSAYPPATKKPRFCCESELFLILLS